MQMQQLQSQGFTGGSNGSHDPAMLLQRMAEMMDWKDDGMAQMAQQMMNQRNNQIQNRAMTGPPGLQNQQMPFRSQSQQQPPAWSNEQQQPRGWSSDQLPNSQQFYNRSTDMDDPDVEELLHHLRGGGPNNRSLHPNDHRMYDPQEQPRTFSSGASFNRNYEEIITQEDVLEPRRSSTWGPMEPGRDSMQMMARRGTDVGGTRRAAVSKFPGLGSHGNAKQVNSDAYGPESFAACSKQAASPSKIKATAPEPKESVKSKAAANRIIKFIIPAEADADIDLDEPLPELDTPCRVIIGPTDLAVQPLQLKDAVLPNPYAASFSFVQSREEQTCLSDCLRLAHARSFSAPLSFGSVLHVINWPGDSCRPCMFEHRPGRCKKAWLCDFCHCHDYKKNRKPAG